MSELNLLQQSLLKRIDKKNIISIGDSHSLFFKELDYITVKHIGPVTAYNLTKDNSSTRGKELLFETLNSTSKQDTAIILSFGEIDLRVHVVKTAIRDSISIYDSAVRTVDRYIESIKNIHDSGWSLLINGPHASGEDRALNLDFPYSGSMEERNYATIIFNLKLEEFCNKNKILFSSLYDLVIDNTLITKSEYIDDGCHLNVTPILQGIALSRFCKNNLQELVIKNDK